MTYTTMDSNEVNFYYYFFHTTALPMGDTIFNIMGKGQLKKLN